MKHHIIDAGKNGAIVSRSNEEIPSITTKIVRRNNMARKLAALIVGILLMTAFSQAQAGNLAAPLSTPEIKQSINSGQKTVIFFLNPYGRPCQAQNEILTRLQKDKKNNFNIAYVSAEKQENKQAFYDYGVRGLPTLVLVDSSGRIGRMFPPGIQPYDALVAALDGIK
jgi:thioredoxin 1